MVCRIIFSGMFRNSVTNVKNVFEKPIKLCTPCRRIQGKSICTRPEHKQLQFKLFVRMVRCKQQEEEHLTVENVTLRVILNIRSR